MRAVTGVTAAAVSVRWPQNNPLAAVMERLGAGVEYLPQDHAVGLALEEDSLYLYHKIGTQELTLAHQKPEGEAWSALTGETVDMGDAMLLDYGEGYTGSRGFTQPCAVDRVIYALSYGESNQEMVAIDLDSRYGTAVDGVPLLPGCPAALLPGQVLALAGGGQSLLLTES